MSRDRRLTLWLIPCAADAVRFQAVIDQLATMQGAPRFRPHMTLASFDTEPPDLGRTVELLRDLRLSPREIDRSDLFTQSLFLRVEANESLLRAREMLESEDGFRSGRTFDPHLSLCYGAPPMDANAVPEMAALLDATIRFDRLVTAEIQVPVESYDDIRAWRDVRTHLIE